MLHGSRNSDPDKITAEEILEMATRHGARGLGVGDGSLEAGQPADAAVLDLQRLRPTQNVIDSIVFAAGRDAVSTVVVGGDPILHKGSISGLDEDGLLREAEEIARETVSGANLSDEVASPWFVGRGRIVAGSSLSGGMVVTMDDSRRVLSEGTVIVEEGRIADVVPGNIAHGERIDCRGKLILPGLVNAHVHALEGLWRGSGSNMRLIEWIRTRRYPLTAQLDDRGAAVSMRLACADMVRSGTTAFLEPEVGAGFLSAVAAAASQSGLRAGLAVSVGARGREALDDPVAGDSGGFRADDDAVQAARADAIDLRGPALGEAVEAWHGAADGRLSVWIGWHVLRRADRNIAQLIRRRADEHDLRITYHAAEFPGSVEMVMERTGLRPAEYADSVGLLGPGTVIGHGVHFEPEEFSILSRTGTTIAHCPATGPRAPASHLWPPTCALGSR